MTTHTEESLSTLTAPQLVSIYNSLSPTSPVTRFRDKATGINRILAQQSSLVSNFTPATSDPTPYIPGLQDPLADYPQPLIFDDATTAETVTPPVLPRKTKKERLKVYKETSKARILRREAMVEKNWLRQPNKKPGSKGDILYQMIPDDATSVITLQYMGVPHREIWWSFCLGFLKLDGKLWEDTDLATDIAIARWGRKDLYHRLPDGYEFSMNKGKERYRLNEEKTAFLNLNRKKYSLTEN